MRLRIKSETTDELDVIFDAKDPNTWDGMEFDQLVPAHLLADQIQNFDSFNPETWTLEDYAKHENITPFDVSSFPAWHQPEARQLLDQWTDTDDEESEDIEAKQTDLVDRAKSDLSDLADASHEEHQKQLDMLARNASNYKG